MRYYSSSAVETTLSAPITSGATSMTVGSVSGFPVQYPYTLSLDADNISKELVEVTAAIGTTLTIVRGVDGTPAVTHAVGARITHDHSARDFRESRQHEAATTAVHGVAGAVVGTTDTQALTNKDLSGGSNIFPGSLATLTGVQAMTNKDLTSGTNSFPTSLATLTGVQTLTNKNLTSGTNSFPTTLATLTGVQVLTNKDLTSGTNTFPTTLVTLTGTQTLTNKTLTNPVTTSGLFGGPAITDPAITVGGTAATAPFLVANLAALPTASGVANGSLGVTADGVVYQERSDSWKPLTWREFIRRSGNTASIANNTTSKVSLTLAEEASSPSNITYSAGDFTVANAGLYQLQGWVEWPSNATGTRRSFIYVGSTEIARTAVPPVTGSFTSVPVSIVTYLAAGSVVSLRCLQSSGGALSLQDVNFSIVALGT